MGTHMMELRDHKLVTMGSRQGLYIINGWALHIFRTPIPPFTPVSCSISCSGESITHRYILRADCFLGIIRIITIGKGITLVKTSLLGGTGWGTHCASVSSGKINALLRQTVQVRSQYIRQPFGFSFILSIRPDRAPSQVIGIEIKNIGPLVCTV